MVFSMDLTITRNLGVMGELACFKGLKFRITFKMRFATCERALITMERVFKVASIKIASLYLSVSEETGWVLHLPRAFLKDTQHPVQQSGGLCFKVSRS